MRLMWNCHYGNYAHVEMFQKIDDLSRFAVGDSRKSDIMTASFVPQSLGEVAGNSLYQLFKNRETIPLGVPPANCQHVTKHVQHDVDFDTENDTPAFRTVKVLHVFAHLVFYFFLPTCCIFISHITKF
jgi:hypothetical protein